MNFKKSTDSLLEAVTLQDLAGALGVSVQAIRQARAVEGSTSHRTPPGGWEAAIAKLARRQAAKMMALAARLEA